MPGHSLSKKTLQATGYNLKRYTNINNLLNTPESSRYTTRKWRHCKNKGSALIDTMLVKNNHS